MIGLQNSRCTLAWTGWIRKVNLVGIPFKKEAAEAVKSLHLVWKIWYCSCWDSFEKTGHPSSYTCSYFYDIFTKLLVHIAIEMVNTHDKFSGGAVQNGNGRSNQIPSLGTINLLLLLLRFLWKDRLPIIMPLLVFLCKVYKIAGAHCHRDAAYAWQIWWRYHSKCKR